MPGMQFDLPVSKVDFLKASMVTLAGSHYSKDQTELALYLSFSTDMYKAP